MSHVHTFPYSTHHMYEKLEKGRSPLSPLRAWRGRLVVGEHAISTPRNTYALLVASEREDRSRRLHSSERHAVHGRVGGEQGLFGVMLDPLASFNGPPLPNELDAALLSALWILLKPRPTGP